MLELKVDNITCGHCVAAVTKALKAVDPEARVNVDLPTKRVQVDSAKPVAALTRALDEAGYPAR